MAAVDRHNVIVLTTNADFLHVMLMYMPKAVRDTCKFHIVIDDRKIHLKNVYYYLASNMLSCYKIHFCSNMISYFKTKWRISPSQCD